MWFYGAALVEPLIIIIITHTRYATYIRRGKDQYTRKKNMVAL